MPERKMDKQANEQIWDGAAPSYNRVGPNFYSDFGVRLIELLSIPSGSNVLDIATGTGAVLIPAARRTGMNGHVTGIDLSNQMLQQTKRIVKTNGLNNVDLLKMDAEHLEFPDSTFDFVTCAFGIFFFPDMAAALHEMYRVCKPSGFIGITVFDKNPPTFSPGVQLYMQQVTAYNALRIASPYSISWAPEEVKTLLGQQAFHSIVLKSEPRDLIYANPEEWWAFLLTLASRGTIMAMDEKTRARFKDEYCAKLQSMMQPDGLHIKVGALYAIAQR
jgi:ubiquinone/menaquinone biosynthesis C-methylase UbiE